MTTFTKTKSAKIVAGLVGLVAGVAMFAITAQAATFTTNLKQGSTGADVKNLQLVLNMSADTQVAATGAGSPGNETSYFGPATKAAVIKFQNKYASEILAPVGLTSGTGFVGASTRAMLNGASGSVTSSGTVPGCSSLVGFSPTTGQSCATGATTSTVPGCTSMVGFSPTTGMSCASGAAAGTATGAGFNVSLASDSPMSGALVAGQALADLAHLKFSNNSGSEVKVTSITLNRTGVSNDDTLVNVYLYNGANRLTDSTSVSSGKVTFNSSTGIFTIPAGASITVKVLGDILSTSAGQIVGVSLASVTSTGTLTTTLPVTGGYLNIATATLGTIDFNTTTTPSASSVDPQNDYTVWQNTVTVGTHALNLKALTLRNIGSINTSDIKNFRLYVDGSVVSTVANLDSNGYVTFDLSSSPKSLATGGRIIKVVADITGGSTRTFMMSLRQASDVTAVDSDLNQAVLATANGSTFSARSATSATITSGSLSVTKAASSPSSDIAVASSNVKLGSFEFRAAGENIKIENLNVQADTSIHNGGLDNGKVFFNGVQVGSTKDLAEATTVNFTFGSSLVVNAGTTGIIDIYADAKTSTGTNLSATETALVTIAIGTSGNAQGMSSLNTLTVPASAVAANTITVAASTLTTTKSTGYGNQTMVAGRANAKIGSFVLSAGSSEGVNVDTLTIGLSAATAASITNLTLKDNATGTTIGTVKTTPQTSNAFGVNIALSASGSKTIDIYADILTAANIGTFAATTAAATGTGTLGTSVSATAVTLQTITVGSGSLTLARAAGNPVSANVIAGSTNVKIGQFVFNAANDSYTIEKLKIKVPSNAATSTTGITLSYKDVGGVVRTVTQTLTAPLAGVAESDATATFDGLTMYVPSSGEDALLDVFVGIPTIASGASSGAAITATIDYNEGYQQKNSAGTTATTIGSADVTAASGSNGTFYVRKSVPTFARVTTGLTSVPTTGQALYKFSVTADTAASVDFKKISLTVATSGVIVQDMYIREQGSSTNLNTTAANATTTANIVSFTIGTSDTDDIQQIAAGTTKVYEITGTVTGWNLAGDSVVFSITDDTAVASTGTSVGHGGYFVWSDRSATSHTTITSDWINGYLLKDLSTDAYSYTY